MNVYVYTVPHAEILRFQGKDPKSYMGEDKEAYCKCDMAVMMIFNSDIKKIKYVVTKNRFWYCPEEELDELEFKSLLFDSTKAQEDHYAQMRSKVRDGYEAKRKYREFGN